MGDFPYSRPPTTHRGGTGSPDPVGGPNHGLARREDRPSGETEPVEESELAGALFDDPSTPPRNSTEALSRAARILEATTRQNERILTLLQRLDDAVTSLEGTIRGAIVGRDTHVREADQATAQIRAELERLRLSLDAAVAAQGRVRLWRYEGPV